MSTKYGLLTRTAIAATVVTTLLSGAIAAAPSNSFVKPFVAVAAAEESGTQLSTTRSTWTVDPVRHEVGKTQNAVAVGEDGRVFTIARGADDSATSAVVVTSLSDLNAETARFELPYAYPDSLQLGRLSDGREVLIIQYYRSDVVEVRSATDGSLITTITGDQRFSGGFLQLPDSPDKVLAYASKGITPLDLTATAADALIGVPEVKYPSVKGLAFNPAQNFVWVAEGRNKALLAFDPANNTWLTERSVALADLQIDGAAVGGRPALVAVDPTAGATYVVLTPTSADEWTEAKLLVIDSATGAIKGSPINVGAGARGIAVNPTTHEVVVAAADENSLVIVDPTNWTTSKLDLTAAGLTQGSGSASADLGALAFDASGQNLIVTLPYQGNGALARITLTPVPDAPTTVTLPGDAAVDTTPDELAPYTASAPVDSAPSDATGRPSTDQSKLLVQSANISWPFNEYSAGWTRLIRPLGAGGGEGSPEAELDGSSLVFRNTTSQNNWWDPLTRNGAVSFSGAITFKPYPDLVPKMEITLAHPQLIVRTDGTATLNADLTWVDPDGKASPQVVRVPVAEFTDVAIEQRSYPIDAADITITGTPVYTGHTYQVGDKTFADSWPHEFIEALPEAMRAWFYSTGASMDPAKQPAEFKAVLTLWDPLWIVPEPTTEETTPAETSTEKTSTAEPTTEPTTAEPTTTSAPVTTTSRPVTSTKVTSTTKAPERPAGSAGSSMSGLFALMAVLAALLGGAAFLLTQWGVTLPR